MKRALRAPFNGGAGRQVLQCARTALYLCWIPAFAGMTKREVGMTKREAGMADEGCAAADRYPRQGRVQGGAE